MWDDVHLSSERRDRLARRQFLQASVAGVGSVVGVGQTSASESEMDWQSSADPIEIEDWHDLDAVRDDIEGEYVLVADLDETTDGYDEHVGDPEEGWEPIGDFTTSPFEGGFDGQGHEIAGLQIDRPETNYDGIFGVNSGIIENVTITDTDITGDFSVGSLIGQNTGEVTDVSVREANIAGGRNVGGLIGWNDGEVTNVSIREVDTTGDERVGGLVGRNWDEVKESSVHEADITGDLDIGGLVGRNSGDVRNSYYNLDSVRINGEQHLTVGGIFDQQYQDWLANDRELRLEDYDSLSEDDGWIELTDVQSVRDALGFIGNRDLNWRLQTDLDLTGVDAGLYFPYFAGTLDGNDHTITVALDLPGVSKIGIVGRNAGELVAVTGEGTVTGNRRVGCLVGRNSGTVRESSVREAEITGNRRVGGLAGRNMGRIVESSVREIEVTGDESVGGLVGRNTVQVYDSSVREADITGDDGAGGLIGENDGRVRNSYYTLDSVRINGEQHLTVGGIFDQQYQDWLANDRELRLEDYDSLSEDDGWIELTDVQSVRDALGFTQNPDRNWRLQTDLDLTGDDAGLYFPYVDGTLDGNDHTITVDLDLSGVSGVGVVGQNAGELSELVGSGTIAGSSAVGGLIGHNDGEVRKSFVHEADVTGDNDAGGLVGHNTGEVTEASVRAVKITGNNRVGGLVGWNREEVWESSVRESDVTSERTAGGLVGQNEAEVRKSAVRDTDITADEGVGGLVGRNFEEVSESWAAGDTTGSSEVGGLVGLNSGTVTAGYWDTESTDQSEGVGDDDGDVTGFTTDEMHGETATEHMDALDFEETWAVQTDPDDYPTLQWLDDTTDPTDDDTADSTDDTTDADDGGPGFGVTETVTGVGGIAYILKRRLADDESDPEDSE